MHYTQILHKYRTACNSKDQTGSPIFLHTHVPQWYHRIRWYREKHRSIEQIVRKSSNSISFLNYMTWVLHNIITILPLSRFMPMVHVSVKWTNLKYVLPRKTCFSRTSNPYVKTPQKVHTPIYVKLLIERIIPYLFHWFTLLFQCLYVR